MKKTAGIGLVLPDQGRILLVQHSASYGGTWSIPKGHVDYGETLREAAVRELLEETGIVLPEERLIGPPLPTYNKRKRLFVWLINASRMGLPHQLELTKKQREEISKAHFVPISWAYKVLPNYQASLLRDVFTL